MKTAAATKQYQKLDSALNVVTSTLMKASRQSMFSFERAETVPEADVAALREAIEGALPLLDFHFEDPKRQLPTKLATRLKNFRKLLATMRDVSDGEALASVFMKLQGRTTDVWRKFLEYRDEALMIVRSLDEEQMPVVDIGSYSVQPFNTGRGDWTDENWSTLTYVLRQGEKLLQMHGMGKYVGGAVLAYPTRTLPPSAGGGGSTLAMYRRRDDIMWLATGGDPRRVLQTFIHETGHRVYWRLIGNRGRATWEEYFEGNTGAPDVDTVVRAWEAWVAAPAKAGLDDWERVKYGRYLTYWIKHLMKSGETELLMWTEIIADKAGVEEKIDSLTGSPKRNSVPGLDQILAKKNAIQSFLSPVTAYSATSAGELFAEVFAHYIVDGPSRIPPDVRAEFRRALPGIRTGSGSPLSLRRDYGESDAAPLVEIPSAKTVAAKWQRKASGGFHMETLPKGSILYRGTPYGKQKFPTENVAWFTADREVALAYAQNSWRGRTLDFVEEAEKTPSVRKYTVTKTLRLPFAKHTEVGDVLAHYGEEAGLGEYPVLRVAINNLGWWSSANGWVFHESHWDENDRARLGEPVMDALRSLGQFREVGGFLSHLCKKTDFHGWIASHEDGGSEVLLCDPTSVLKANSRQNPYRNRDEREEAKVRKDEGEEWRAEVRQEFEEKVRKKVEEGEFERKRAIVMSVFFWGGVDVDRSDPEVKEVLRHWDEYLTDADFRMFGGSKREWQGDEKPGPSAYRVASRSLHGWPGEV